ncbi:hypothetical protein QBC38DRAFT_463935 [Podospora fimiseda]|uniref:Autophagy-related protein 29 n=1 Tax=Podospora fimiseda TaxID=252190 RepID=A0AAN7H538_9PEZI|nr:hypothetical protein QBC38DRAFT_463935 [Podospora fimiseda]
MDKMTGTTNNWVVDLSSSTSTEEQTPQDFINKLNMESKRRAELFQKEMDKERLSKQTSKEEKSPKYTVYVRLPFNRGDFVDPPPVNWDEKKSEALWMIISSSAHQINWDQLASHFNVSLEFIIHMANYLAERHTTQLRAQISKVTANTARGDNAQAMKRTGSTKGNRPPSSLSMRSQTPTILTPKNEPSRPTTIPIRPPVSRNSSASTAVPTQNDTTSARPSAPATRLSEQVHSDRRRFSVQNHPQQARPTKQGIPKPSSPGPASSSSSDNDSDDDSPVHSRIIRRPPFSTHNRERATFGGVQEEEEEPEAAFLAFAAPASATTSNQDMNSTLRGNLNLRNLVGARASYNQPSRSQTSDSSNSSAAIIEHQGQPSTSTRGGGNRYPSGGEYGHGGALSPRRTAELKGKGTLRDAGSDGTGTPSMGSSFSDLDDTSVTDSALEEALASRMQDGTLGSRMSIMGATLGHAIKSRYLPKSNGQ